MNIGILTYYKVPNFGANLQAVSTYNYLKTKGHEVVFLYYLSHYTDYVRVKSLKVSAQLKVHFDFIDQNLPQDDGKLFSSAAVMNAAHKHHLDAIIIGSDAVLQHFPLFSTLRWGQSMKAWLRPIEGERRFPNAFWGYGITDKIPTAMVSVSSQNSPYNKWLDFTKHRMAKCLNNMRYISVRDVWTQKLVKAVSFSLNPTITPDPVFAFNQNAGHLVPSKKEICEKFGLKENYALVGLRGDVLSYETLVEIEKRFGERGIECVAFPIGHTAELPYKKQIKYPLNPLDWYALLKYSSAYIGNNMHPIVVSLHNAVPCFSIDNWGTTNFWGKRIDDGSSKVQDILDRYGLSKNRRVVEAGHCNVSAKEIFDALDTYNVEKVREISSLQFKRYDDMMINCLEALK